jgi:SOS regulatory protein LexA
MTNREIIDRAVQDRGSLLADFYQRKRRMPSYAEAANLFGVRSKDSAYRIIRALIARGSVAKDRTGKLIPMNVHGNGTLRVLGLVEAGFPTPAEEATLDTVSLDEWLVDRREASFMLRVKGESMRDAGIRDGDMVIVERTTNAKLGQIVIAEVDGGWTMKYLRQDQEGFYLEPANPDFDNIRPEEDMRISAIVKAVVRKY